MAGEGAGVVLTPFLAAPFRDCSPGVGENTFGDVGVCMWPLPVSWGCLLPAQG